MSTDFTFKNRKNIHAAIIISECKTECKDCPVVYYTNSRKLEFCMCRCHSHAAHPQREEEPKTGIGVSDKIPIVSMIEDVTPKTKDSMPKYFREMKRHGLRITGYSTTEER